MAARGPDVIDEAGHSHRYLLEHGQHRSSPTFDRRDAALCADPLPEPSGSVDSMRFGEHMLASVRRFVADAARRRSIDPGRLADLLVAVNELATNSVCHGGGHGTVRVWLTGDDVVCEVSDDGVMTDPLLGRRRPDASLEGGRGLWIVNQLCDLVELRSAPGGTVVRVHFARA